MGDRFYGQQQGKFGYKKASVASSTKANSASKPRRRLKAEIVDSIGTMLGKDLPSLNKMTVADLEYLEEYLYNV